MSTSNVQHTTVDLHYYYFGTLHLYNSYTEPSISSIFCMSNVFEKAINQGQAFLENLLKFGMIPLC